MGFLAWVVTKIKYFFVGAALIGPFIVFMFVRDGMHVRDVLANGTETVAASEA